MYFYDCRVSLILVHMVRVPFAVRGNLSRIVRWRGSQKWIEVVLVQYRIVPYLAPSCTVKYCTVPYHCEPYMVHCRTIFSAPGGTVQYKKVLLLLPCFRAFIIEAVF